MKKWAMGILLAGMLVMQVPVFASGIQVQYEGTPIAFEVSPFIQEGTTMVPMRAVSEALGAEVIWSASAKVVTVKKNGVELSIPVDGTVAKRNGEEVSLEVPATIVEGRVFVPLRFVGEQLGVNVVWDKETKTVALTEKAAEKPTPATNQYTSKDGSYTITMPEGNWIAEDVALENTLILDKEGTEELTFLLARYSKEEVAGSGYDTLEKFATFNRENSYSAVYAMGVVTPQSISLENMKSVQADEITAEENGTVSKAFVIYGETEKNYYICAFTGIQGYYDAEKEILLRVLETMVEA